MRRPRILEGVGIASCSSWLRERHTPRRVAVFSLLIRNPVTQSFHRHISERDSSVVQRCSSCCNAIKSTSLLYPGQIGLDCSSHSNAAQSKPAETPGRRVRGLPRETGDSRHGSPAASAIGLSYQRRMLAAFLLAVSHSTGWTSDAASSRPFANSM